jgi:hypothetical protein
MFDICGVLMSRSEAVEALRKGTLMGVPPTPEEWREFVKEGKKSGAKRRRAERRERLRIAFLRNPLGNWLYFSLRCCWRRCARLGRVMLGMKIPKAERPDWLQTMADSLPGAPIILLQIERPLTFAEITKLANKVKDEARRAGFSKATVESILLLQIRDTLPAVPVDKYLEHFQSGEARDQVEAMILDCPPAEVQSLCAWLQPNRVEVVQ